MTPIRLDVGRETDNLIRSTVWYHNYHWRDKNSRHRCKREKYVYVSKILNTKIFIYSYNWIVETTQTSIMIQLKNVCVAWVQKPMLRVKINFHEGVHLSGLLKIHWKFRFIWL